MLKKYVFELNVDKFDQTSQEILFSQISDQLIGIGSLSVSNIPDVISSTEPLKHLEVITDDKIDRKKIIGDVEKFVRIINLDEFDLATTANWVESYKENVEPVIIKNRLFIAPDWVKVPQEKSELSVIRINPGMAFGTGLHATTQLCLESICEVSLSNKNVIDLGCGSGILGIACLIEGANHISFIDNDYVALGITRENVQKNCSCSANYILVPSLAKVSKKADYIFANILLNPLKKMARLILSRLKIKGHIFLSGILIEQVKELVTAFEKEAGRRIVKVKESHMKQWACVQITYG